MSFVYGKLFRQLQTHIQIMNIVHVLSLFFIIDFTRSYQKIRYLTSYEKITAIANCKSLNNLIYTTESNKLIMWINYNIKQEYNLSGISSQHLIECSRYSSSAQQAFIAVLSGKMISLWEEVVQTTYYSYLLEKQFQQKQHSSPPSHLSLGLNYLAVGYKEQNLVDIYNLKEPRKIPISIKVTGLLMCMKMDYLENLALVVNHNNSYVFYYHQFPDYESFFLSEEFDFEYYNSTTEANISIDYQMPQKQQIIGSPYKIVFLISAPYQAIFINYTLKNFLTKHQKTQNNHSSGLQICDNTKSTSQANMIWKQSDGNVLEVDNPIIQFGCVKQPGIFIDSLYFVVSKWQNQYYIDCFSVANWKVWLLLGLAVFIICCCGCFYTIIKMANHERRQCLNCIDNYFCLCPSEENIQSIQQRLME